MNRCIWLTLALVLGCAWAEKTLYTGYKLYNLFPETQEQGDVLASIEHNEDFDMWERVRKEGVKASLAPEVVEKYETLFKKHNIRYEIVHENLQELFDEEQQQMKRDAPDGKITSKYRRYSEIRSWAQDQARLYPQLVNYYVPGYSNQNRELGVIQIGATSATRHVWIDCGIHAREWISPFTCVWIAHNLIEDYNRGVPNILNLLNGVKFHIMPLVNPDGYEFSHDTTRMWRKNRRQNVGSTCIGTDLNRNFPYMWFTGGSSNQPCVDTYAGPSAGSESETKAVMAAISAHIGNWDLMVTIHSYGKWIFTPWGYTSNPLPDAFGDQKIAADFAKTALEAVNNERGWIVGNSAQILYVASGGTEDWAHAPAPAGAGIKYSYCYELRPGSSDPAIEYNYGFAYPETKAHLAGEETYRSILALHVAAVAKP